MLYDTTTISIKQRKRKPISKERGKEIKSEQWRKTKH